MHEHTRRLLEWNRILDELQGYCLSSEGAEALAAEDILLDREEIARRLSLTGDVRRALESGESLPQLPFPQVSELLPRLGKPGSVLEAEELAAVALFIRSGDLFARFLRSAAPGTGAAATAAELPDLRPLATKIFRYIDQEGNLKEREIPELAAIRDRIKKIHGEIGALASRYFQDPAMQSFWQSATPTHRDGRTVLPLKANFKGRIKGIVHEVSASGSTVYIEPFDIVERNNGLTEEQNAYRREVLRILRDLTGIVSERIGEIETFVEGIAFLDGFHARARYATVYRCSRAAIRDEGIELKEARHPLLGRKAVPIDLVVQPGTQCVIVTGPNTGGKTVSLKTAGLLSLMHQFGMQIPAAEGSGLPLFDGIYADIGDEQSIEQSLSTFSSHMTNISSIVRYSTSRSLILLDELGSGTDPEEGSALAMSILDCFIERGSMVLATTHHGILKNYGYTRAGVMNASVEFDSRSLSPTYRLILGLPGESHALDIASRNGIPEAIVGTARQYLDDERTDVAKLIRNLGEKQRELLELERDAGRRARELQEKRRETDLQALRLRQEELQLRTSGVSELNRFLSESRRELERLVQELREGELTREKTLKVKRFVESLARETEQQEERLRSDEEHLGQTLRDEREDGRPAEFRVGMEVFVGPGRKRGTIVRKGRGDGWVVATETMRLTVPERDLSPASPTSRQPSVEVSVSSGEGANPVLELNVRGMRLEEALGALQNQLDRALVKGLQEFSVIHGMGEGILQRGVHDFLGRTQAVREFFFARPEEGGFGKTIVRL